jgi:ubiquinol-cytochrome c reductase iron-sulfur subunit
VSDESIRDRLSSPAGHGEQSSGGDSSRSDITSADFQQTDSRSSHGPSQTMASPHGAPPAEGGHSHGPKDPEDTRGAERAVAALFLLAVIGAVGFVVSFIAIPFDYGKDHYQWYTPALGLFMTLALVGIGAGAVLWAKTLMNDEETVQERHHLASTDESRAETVAILKQGAADSGLGRRSLLRNSLLLGSGALAILPIPLLFGLGHFQHKERELSKTGWKKGSRLLDELGRPVKMGDLEVGGVKSVFPDVPGGRRMADSAALIIRMQPDVLHPRESRKDWAVDGHIVYSVICTHLGCPVKLYEQQTHHLFCPCHQSTFDAAREAKVLFGPAARNLPQLAIALDDEGYFVAQGDFSEPVGPSFWERKDSYPDKVGNA